MDLSTLELGESTDRGRAAQAQTRVQELDHQRLADAVAAGEVSAMRGI